MIKQWKIPISDKLKRTYLIAGIIVWGIVTYLQFHYVQEIHSDSTIKGLVYGLALLGTLVSIIYVAHIIAGFHKFGKERPKSAPDLVVFIAYFPWLLLVVMNLFYIGASYHNFVKKPLSLGNMRHADYHVIEGEEVRMCANAKRRIPGGSFRITGDGDIRITKSPSKPTQLYRRYDRIEAVTKKERNSWGRVIRGELESVELCATVHFPEESLTEPINIEGTLSIPCTLPVALPYRKFKIVHSRLDSYDLSISIFPRNMKWRVRTAWAKGFPLFIIYFLFSTTSIAFPFLLCYSLGYRFPGWGFLADDVTP